MSAPFSYVEIEAVDELEFDLPCSGHYDNQPCPAAAEWTVTKACCEADAQLCDPCYVATSPCHCVHCGSRFMNGRDMIKNAMRIK